MHRGTAVRRKKDGAVRRRGDSAPLPLRNLFEQQIRKILSAE